MARCKRSRFCSLVLIALLLATTGCGAQDWGYLSGTVRLDGAPVGPGSMSLERIDAETAGAVAVIGEDGTYNVMSAGRKEGARVGEYRVMVFNSQDFKPVKGKIPERYGNPSTSDLTVKIEPGKNTADFDLKP